jgi:serine/threonine protein kinase
MSNIFMKEFYSIIKLNHKNLVEYHEAFLEISDEDLFFCTVMEYMDYGDLEKFIKENTNLDIYAYLKILKNIAEGIEYLHNNSIIHRDLKPGNIFLKYDEDTKEYIIKIGDFGYSLIDDMKTTNTICGTLKYMVKKIILS